MTKLDIKQKVHVHLYSPCTLSALTRVALQHGYTTYHTVYFSNEVKCVILCNKIINACVDCNNPLDY